MATNQPMSRIAKYALLFCLALILIKTCVPTTYDVPHPEQRASTQYWDLPTGSHIGYTLLKAKGHKKPYSIIYLHGGPGGPIYDRNITLLAPLAEEGYDVYLYDQVGGGASGRLDNISDYTADRHVRDLAEIVQKIGTQKVILIAQSWGAILAVLFAADHPAQIEKIIFTSPGPLAPVRLELSSLPGPDSLQLRTPDYSNANAVRETYTLRSKAILKVAQWFGQKLASDAEADDFATYLNIKLRKSTVCDTTKLSPLLTGGGGYYVQVMTMQSLQEVQDPRPKLENSDIPILVMKGQCDNQKWGYTQEYLQIFPNHIFVPIKDAGHAIAVEQPEIYLQEIRNFLSVKRSIH